jgi:cobalt-zinc-cadmium efflux system outer membrane protein
MPCFVSNATMPAATSWWLGILVVALGGCSSIPAERGYEDARTLVAARLGPGPEWPVTDRTQMVDADLPTSPIDVHQAVRLAFIHNPAIRAAYARLGFSRADLEAARRIANPSIGYARLEPSSGAGTQVTRSLAISFTELLLLPARRRFATAELERVQFVVADELLTLATEVEVAWYESVTADRIAAMRALSAEAAGHSARLAERFFAAGNINRLQLAQEQANATQARILGARAAVTARLARSALASLIGLPAHLPWTTEELLPAPLSTDLVPAALVQLALSQRLDLAAAQQDVALRTEALAVARRWRWLGRVEFAYERESEPEGGSLSGPSLAVELPIFNQGQDAIARADATLMAARARLDALVAEVENDVRLGRESIELSRDISEQYRTALVPQREAIVAGTQAEVNFMLAGVFELIAAKQSEYDAYQSYLESVRDYWTARARLRGAVGGRLPDDDAEPQPTIGIDALLRRPPVAAGQVPRATPDSGPVQAATPSAAPHVHGEQVPFTPAPAHESSPMNTLPAAPEYEAAHHAHGDAR